MEVLIDQQVLTTYQQSADRAVKWLVGQMKEDGAFQVPVKDLAFYYKVPLTFYIFREKFRKPINC